MNALLMLCALSQPFGVAIGLHPSEAERRGIALMPNFDELAALGAGGVLIPVSFAQPNIHSEAITPFEGTLRDSLLKKAIRGAKRAALGITLMPIIELTGEQSEWRGRISPKDEAKWWRAYTAFITRYAHIATNEKVDIFIIGSELSSMSTPERGPRWMALSQKVRRLYQGPLAFVANHDALDLSAPFSAVDIAGVSAYFPLSEKLDPKPRELAAGWKAAHAKLKAFHQRVKKPLVLFEVGYPSIDGATMRPWDYLSGAPIDLLEQRDAYAAAVDAIIDAGFIKGAFFWGWTGPGGPHDRHYTPRGKPALLELIRLFESVRVHAAR